LLYAAQQDQQASLPNRLFNKENGGKLMDKFALALDSIDPSSVPQRKLNSGDLMPGIGMGTFGSDRFTPDQVANGVKEAVSVGFRFLDCARCYGNEDLIGEVLQDIFDSKSVKREDLFIDSKVWNDMHGKGDILLSLSQTLKDLRLDYLDLFFVHWPFPNYHPPGCDADTRNPLSRPYIHDEFMEVWSQMEKLVKSGLVRNLGLSNVTVPKLKLILRDAQIKPACNEMELHPHFQQEELFRFCLENGIQPVGFCPIGSPTRPDRDKTETDTVDIQDPIIVDIAKKHGVHPAVICIKWATQRGQIPIPFSVYRNEILSNISCVANDPLTEQEMASIAAIDKDCRLIKGQVFLWEGASDWHDLWDEDGTIAGWNK
jgi:alcohol dehydrogenase (NADP+)